MKIVDIANIDLVGHKNRMKVFTVFSVKAQNLSNQKSHYKHKPTLCDSDHFLGFLRAWDRILTNEYIIFWNYFLSVLCTSHVSISRQCLNKWKSVSKSVRRILKLST